MPSNVQGLFLMLPGIALGDAQRTFMDCWEMNLSLVCLQEKHPVLCIITLASWEAISDHSTSWNFLANKSSENTNG